jgi:hypothetical protein
MKFAWKIINLCFLLVFVFICPLWAEDEEELKPVNEEPLISEETPVTEEPLISEETPVTEEPLISEETPVNEESLISEEPRFIDQESSGEELSFDDDFDALFNEFVFSGQTIILEAPVFEIRTLNEVFPNLTIREKATVMSERGLRNAFEKNDTPTFLPGKDAGIDLYSKIMSKKPSHVIEALVLVPYGKRELDLIDIYNALSRIKSIQDFKIISRGKEYKIFQETTRLESAQKRKPIPDPPHTDTLPYSEIMYLRFLDQTLGDLYLRGEISVSLYGLSYILTNFRDVSYSIFKVMSAERFITIIYLEPVKEGILIYSMSGLYIPSFVSSRINLTSSMNFRVTILINWITDGLRKEENNEKTKHFYQLKKE